MGGHHRLAHVQEPRCKSFGSAALSGNAGSLQKEMQFVGQHFGLAQAGLLAQPHQPRSLRPLILLDNPPGGVILLGQFDRSVGERAAALGRLSKMATSTFSQ
jgi:hypothetical protein